MVSREKDRKRIAPRYLLIYLSIKRERNLYGKQWWLLGDTYNIVESCFWQRYHFPSNSLSCICSSCISALFEPIITITLYLAQYSSIWLELSVPILAWWLKPRNRRCPSCTSLSLSARRDGHDNWTGCRNAGIQFGSLVEHVKFLRVHCKLKTLFYHPFIDGLDLNKSTTLSLVCISYRQ